MKTLWEPTKDPLTRFYPELAGKGSFDLLHQLRKAEPATPHGERFDDNDRRAQEKIQS